MAADTMRASGRLIGSLPGRQVCSRIVCSRLCRPGGARQVVAEIAVGQATISISRVLRLPQRVDSSPIGRSQIAEVHHETARLSRACANERFRALRGQVSGDFENLGLCRLQSSDQECHCRAR